MDSMRAVLDVLTNALKATRRNGGEAEVYRSAAFQVVAENSLAIVLSQELCPRFIRLYERCAASPRSTLVAQLAMYLPALAQNSFANYAVQSMLRNDGEETVKKCVTHYLAGHLFSLSQNKYGSNVVQTLLRACKDFPTEWQAAKRELLQPPFALSVLAYDCYGNFVLQTVVATAPTLAILEDIELMWRPVLAGTPSETNIFAKMPLRLNELVLAGQNHAGVFTAIKVAQHHRGGCTVVNGQAVGVSQELSCSPQNIATALGGAHAGAQPRKMKMGGRNAVYIHNPYAWRPTLVTGAVPS